jgi:hypothetical protein
MNIELRIDRLPGALAHILLHDGLLSALRAAATALLVRLLSVERRVDVWEHSTIPREIAVDRIAEDIAELLPVLNSLVVGASVLIGGGSVAHECVHRDFVAIVRKAAFRCGCAGGDTARLHKVLEEIAEER